MIFTIFKKELKDTLRDRRTFMTMIVIPVLIFPIILNLFVGVSESYSEESATKKVKIGIVSEGENYPTGDVYENTSVINSSTENQTKSLVARNYVVKDVLIQNPGQNYSKTDTASDQFGNQYSIEVFEGLIIKIEPININGNTTTVNDLPIIRIESDTGSGALLRPILDIEPAEFQGEVKQVIDCVK